MKDGVDAARQKRGIDDEGRGRAVARFLQVCCQELAMVDRTDPELGGGTDNSQTHCTTVV